MGQPFKGLGLALVFAGSIQAVASEAPLEFRAHPFLTFDTGTSLTADIELADVDGDGDATFLPAEPLPDDGEGSTHIVIADIDADDRKDLVVARRNGQASVVMKNLGERKFEVTKLPGSEGDHRKAVVADVSGDGVFSPMDLPGEPADTYGVALGDMNGDGRVDIVFANSEAENVLLIAR